MLRFIHAADFHLDSAFGALTARQAATRRRESRELASRLADYVSTSLCPRAVRVCKEGTVLLCEEESWSDCVHADLFAELLCNLSCEECCEVADSCLCRSIAGNAGHRTECSHA